MVLTFPDWAVVWFGFHKFSSLPTALAASAIGWGMWAFSIGLALVLRTSLRAHWSRSAKPQVSRGVSPRPQVAGAASHPRPRAAAQHQNVPLPARPTALSRRGFLLDSAGA